MRVKILAFAILILPLVIAVSASGEISRQQMEAQISFFHDSLAEFGASAPEQAVKLWAKGDETRNGVYKYSVSCDELKQWLVNRWGEPEKNFWIIGGSSPWLTDYKIINQTNISSTEIQYLIEYRWATSAGPEAPSTEELLVKKINDKWCVASVKVLSGYQNY